MIKSLQKANKVETQIQVIVCHQRGVPLPQTAQWVCTVRLP